MENSYNKCRLYIKDNRLIERMIRMIKVSKANSTTAKVVFEISDGGLVDEDSKVIQLNNIVKSLFDEGDIITGTFKISSKIDEDVDIE